MINKHENQSVEIEFWDIEPEDVPELEESDIPGVYFNEFREYVDEEGNIFLGSMAEASIVRLLCHMVPEIYFLADETKLMKKDFIYICQLGKGRNLITNPSISEKCIHTYEQLGACVITE